MLDARGFNHARDLRSYSEHASEGEALPPKVENPLANSSFIAPSSTATHETQSELPTASANADNVLSEKLIPEGAQEAPPSVVTPVSLPATGLQAQPDPHAESPRGRAPSLVTGLASIASSGPVVAAIGSTIITIPITTFGAVALGCTAVWTALNEFRVATQKTSDKNSVFESQAGTPRRGLVGLLTEKLHGPGLAPTIQAICYLYSAAVGFGTGNPFIGAVFTVFAIGASAAAHIGNQGYSPPARECTGFERYLTSTWNALPERVKTVLKDPGASFCSANLALILHQLNLPQAMSSFGTTALFGVGTMLAAMGVARGLFPLVSGRATRPSGTAVIVGGAGDISLGVLSLLSGNAYTGAATVAWGISNILYGCKVGGSFITDWLRRGPTTP